jgi:hypothetical protein
MKKFFLPLFIFCLSHVNGQVSNNLGVWVDHLPYSQAVDVEEFNDVTYVATRQGLFIYSLESRQIERVSKVNGLNDVGLTDIAYSPKYNVLLIGYENGNLDVYDNGQISNYPDIKLSSNYSGLKTINHIHVDEDIAYLSTNFGILAYNIAQDLVKETYIMGPNGTILGVKQTTTDADSLYAGTEQGLYSVALADAKFFFENWRTSQTINQPLDAVTVFDGKLFVNINVLPNGDTIRYRQNGQWQTFTANEISDNRSLRTSKNHLIVTNVFSARAYDSTFTLFKNFNATSAQDSSFNPVAAVLGTSLSNFWVADGTNGLFHFFQLFPFNIIPNSPKTANLNKLSTYEDLLFVSPGAFNDVGAPLFNNDGFFVLEDFDWTNYSSLSIGDYRDVVDLVADPTDPTRLYAAIYSQGILELSKQGDTILPVRLLNEATTGGAFPAFDNNGRHRISDLDMDEEGNLWFTNSLTDRPLGVVWADGSVESFSLGAAGSGANLLKIMATTGGQIWLLPLNSGIIVANVANTANLELKILGANEGNGNLPSESVLSFAEDLDGEIWIGTIEGLAVLFSPENIFEPNRSFDASILVIDEDGDGNGERVLGAEAINDIEVDGSNKKWFATQNSGVFFTSASGRTQLQRFSLENSPLPSNSIRDIAINPNTGMVYFGSVQGMVSYQGQATQGEERMTDVFAYPNPVTPDYNGPILIRGLVTNAQVKITDIEGNVVFETIAEGGQAVWSGRTFSGEKVSSGVYLAYITDDLGANTEVTKILVVN